jgi:hypothetical protein
MRSKALNRPPGSHDLYISSGRARPRTKEKCAENQVVSLPECEATLPLEAGVL